jgi:hypothetical protein
VRNASVGAGAFCGQSWNVQSGRYNNQQVTVHPWLAADAHVNKETNGASFENSQFKMCVLIFFAILAKAFLIEGKFSEIK